MLLKQGLLFDRWITDKKQFRPLNVLIRQTCSTLGAVGSRRCTKAGGVTGGEVGGRSKAGLVRDVVEALVTALHQDAGTRQPDVQIDPLGRLAQLLF